MDDKPEVITTNRARGGVTRHNVRYVLIASVVLAVVAMIWVYARSPEPTNEQPGQSAPQAATNP
jgi:hypothetical protein